MSYSPDQLAFVLRQYPVVNSIYADTLLHNLGAESYVAKARILASVDVDHMHCGSRYWKAVDIVSAWSAANCAKSSGQLAYEADCRARPHYHDGTKRRSWHELGMAVQRNWEGN